MGNIKRFFSDRKTIRGSEPSGVDPVVVIQFKYALFKDLLAANSELLSLLSDMDQTLKGGRDIGSVYVRTQADKAVKHAFKMVKSINMLSGDAYKGLYDVLESITAKITTVISERPCDGSPSYVLDYQTISRLDVGRVGGKNANLSEMKNKLNVPIPSGFAVSTHAFADFLKENSLKQEIIDKRNQIFVEDTKLLSCLSREAMDLIESQPLPDVIRDEILGAYDRLWGKDSGTCVAMRSSAVGEDGDISFAGQYLTLLNVSRERICEAYISIAASLYSSRAVAYRSSRGICDEDLDMAVACMEMVDAGASGVMYTRNPDDPMGDSLLIQGVWGLGTYAVDGVVTPDSFTVSKDGKFRIINVSLASKTIRQVCLKEGGVGEERVEPAKQIRPCLSKDQVRTLARYGRAIESHFKEPQDVEWALDKQGRLVILQARPLNVRVPFINENTPSDPVTGYDILVDKAERICPGIGKGPVVFVQTRDDLINFPEGGVLVSEHPSSKYAAIMNKCKAIVIETGSVCGHLAAISREFNVPTLIGGPGMMDVLTPGMDITVDACMGRVYRGLVGTLIDSTRQPEIFTSETPSYTLLKKLAGLISPLNLVDPESPRFSTECCRTLHDIVRFCHEKSYEEMFKIGGVTSKNPGRSLKLDTALPMDLQLVDLGGGISGRLNGMSNSISMDRIISTPFRPLLSGVLSVVGKTISASCSGDNRFRERGYAIIADKYMNFSSKAGHHYSVVDAYCGQSVNNNYVTFCLKGGSANKTGRIRRIKAIAVILSREGFLVDVSEDMVQARIQKYPTAVIESCLDLIGRLLVFIRKMDTQMTSNASVELVANLFRDGNYSLNYGLS